MHKIVQDFVDKIQTEKESGRKFHEYELLYKYSKFHSYWKGKRIEYELKRKPLRATIYQELRKTAKTQKDAEMQAECSSQYQELIETLIEATQASLDSGALLAGLECRIDTEKRNEIADHVARKHANADGYGS